MAAAYSHPGRDHPRRCGEHSFCFARHPQQAESSPRMRGALAKFTPLAVWFRIIPADAGNTPDCSRQIEQARDHPRGCGEHNVWTNWRPYGYDYENGSSPRMRGTPLQRLCKGSLAGIIPADAGNTIHVRPVGRRSGDHPRGCGEHLATWAYAEWWSGSSPRMRGTRLPGSQINPIRGIIPADAGNT